MTDIVALAATIRNEMQERTDRLLGAACSAIEDWSRVTEWAIEARRLLEEYATGTISDAEMVPKARRLLGEP